MCDHHASRGSCWLDRLQHVVQGAVIPSKPYGGHGEWLGNQLARMAVPSVLSRTSGSGVPGGWRLALGAVALQIPALLWGLARAAELCLRLRSVVESRSTFERASG